ncbi:integrase/recombinase XerD [Flavobacterium sp. 28YEA47A]|uniref:tyrosine-type recombinase/integrase n=1 Tax=Flavobacterium sp. 28YEA47A TaxID=3156276 RepID=UPI0035152271
MSKQIQNPNFERHFQNYENLITAKGFKGTDTTYTTPVKEFLIWLESIGISSIKDVTSPNLVKYFEYLIERPNQKRAGILAGNTVKMHLLTLSMFLDNLLMLGELQKGFSIPRFSASDKNPREVLTIDEIRLLYQYSENPLEEAFLSVGYGCGLRRSELQDLNLSDVQLSTGMLVVRSGKGSKRREVPMSDLVLTAVKRYVIEYRPQFLGKEPEAAFFINPSGKRISGENLNKMLRKIIARTSNESLMDKEITLHCLRHSIAHHLMERNAGLDFIRGFLGHSYINTAYIYAKKNKQSKKLIQQVT